MPTVPDLSPRLPARLRAIVLDVDGTLYRQAPVRRAVLIRLLVAHWCAPARLLRTARCILAYREVQERLRDGAVLAATTGPDLRTRQLALAARRCSISIADVEQTVARWMERTPLDRLARAVRPGLMGFLDRVRRTGLRLAVVSDYAPGEKLTAMGIDRYFPVQVSAQDPDVQRFKPHPRGLEVALGRLGVPAEEALYVGDRAAVDAAAAAAAGVACVLMGRPGRRTARDPLAVGSFTELERLLDDSGLL